MRVKSIKKIAIILVVLTLFNAITPLTTVVHAGKETNSFIVEAGGVLLSAIKNLAVFIADTVLELLQNTMISPQSIVVTTDKPDTVPSWRSVLTIVVGALMMVAAVVLSVVSCGVASGVLVAVIGIAAKIVGVVGIATAAYGGLSAANEYSSGVFDIPYIRYTPFEIFSGQIPLLDVNFINPMKDVKITYQQEDENGKIGYYEWITMYNASYPEDDVFEIHESNFTNNSFGFNARDDLYKISSISAYEYQNAPFRVENSFEDYVDIGLDGNPLELRALCVIDGIEGDITDEADVYKYRGKEIDEYSLENEHINYVEQFLVWFVKKSGLYELSNEEKSKQPGCILFGYCEDHKRCDLSKSCYKGKGCDIEKAAGICMKIDDVYYIILCGADEADNFTFSTAMSADPNSVESLGPKKIEFNSDDEIVILKGKFHEGQEGVAAVYHASSGILQKGVSTWYKAIRRIALVLLLTILVYIGIRIMLCSTAQDKAKYKKMIVDWVAAICILYILHFLIAGTLAITSELSLIFGAKEQELIYAELPSSAKISGTLIGADGYWAGSFMGYSRLVAGFDSDTKSLAYSLIYIMLVIYTVMFTFIYLKRVIYMAFLTMIAPLIAITYPIDKIKDGNAQAFGLWIREFIFNALLQPVHLILYIILIGNCMELAVNYPLYAILALGFMVPAEKFIRKMFGFEKAGTVSQLGAAAGGALVGNALGKMGSLGRGLGNFGKRGQKQQGGAGAEGEGGSNEGGGNIRTVNNSGNNATEESGPNNSEPNNSGPNNSGPNNSGPNNSGPGDDGGGSPRNNETDGYAHYSNILSVSSTSWEDMDRETQKFREAYERANQNTLNSKPKRKIGRAMSKAGKYTGAGLKGLAQVGRYGVKAAGLAGKVVLGGTGAMIGAAAGIASGEGIGGALKYGAAGAAGGAALASGATNLATGAIDGVEGLATRGANTVKGAYAKSKESKDAYNGIKDSSARELAREMNLSPEVAGLAYRIATSISGDALYNDDALKKMVASSGADSATQKQMLEYIKRFR